MKGSLALVLCSLFAIAVAIPARGETRNRIRLMDPAAEAAFARGLDGSAIFRRLVSEIESSDLIVHVATMISLPGKTLGATRLASAGPHGRYVRIFISAELPREQRIAMLAHELQHACEIARSDARNPAALRVLYETIGRPVELFGELYDTAEANAVGEGVWLELRGSK